MKKLIIIVFTIFLFGCSKSKQIRTKRIDSNLKISTGAQIRKEKKGNFEESFHNSADPILRIHTEQLEKVGELLNNSSDPNLQLLSKIRKLKTENNIEFIDSITWKGNYDLMHKVRRAEIKDCHYLQYGTSENNFISIEIFGYDSCFFWTYLSANEYIVTTLVNGSSFLYRVENEIVKENLSYLSNSSKYNVHVTDLILIQNYFSINFNLKPLLESKYPKVLSVLADSIKVRKCPSDSCSISFFLYKEEVVNIINSIHNADGFKWLEISMDGKYGFILPKLSEFEEYLIDGF